MRFFKAFNLLHRRTRSATFVTGSSNSFLGSTDSNLTAPLCPFELAVSGKPLSYPKDDHWWKRRPTNLQPSLKQKCHNAVESVGFWIEECSKLRDLLKCCHTELLKQRLITLALERKICENSTEIAYLRMSSGCGATAVPPAQISIPLSGAASSQDISMATTSTNFNSLHQYSSALRMTLRTRKALRDQKKITKYWKGLAINGTQQSTVTPSASAISSIRETLPAHRQAAVEALQAQRSWRSRVNDVPSESNLSEALYSTHEESSGSSLQADPSGEAVTTPIPSSLCQESQFSRLAPLASESVKDEVNLLFGSSSRLKRISSSIPSSMQIRDWTSTDEGLGRVTSYDLSIGSFQSLSALLQRTFKVDEVLNCDERALIETEETRDANSYPQCAASVSRSSSCILGVIDHSHAWVRAINSNTRFKLTNAELQSSPQRATKKGMTVHSLQILATKSNCNRRKDPEIIQQSVTKGFERKGFPISLPLFKRRQSILPVFRKRES